MSIERRVQLVEKLFSKLDHETSQFVQSTGLHCVAGCGKCCTFPNVEASPLEFLPWAFHLFLNGEAEKTINLLDEIQSTTCIIFQPLSKLGQGSCSNYKYRGLICRLFGYGANSNKYGQLRLATCNIIKEGQANNYANAQEAIDRGLHVPIFTEYYMQLNQIDFKLGNIILPINKALKAALEEVFLYYEYRPYPDLGKKCG